MARAIWNPEGKKPPPVIEPWKPERCEEFGCNRRHPSFSRNGEKGPWRCAEHDRLAGPAAPSPEPAPPPAAPDRLL